MLVIPLTFLIQRSKVNTMPSSGTTARPLKPLLNLHVAKFSVFLNNLSRLHD